MRVMGIVGSLRRGSYNRGLIAAAVELAPPLMTVVPFPLEEIPVYNADYDADHLRPPEVTRLKQTIVESDALIIATPEYNHSVPGVLQNAIDWASRPGLKSPLAGKPVAIMGAATGAVGTARAQQQLKLALLSTLALVMPHAGILVSHAAEKFDASGALVHEATRQFIAAFLGDLEAWARRFQ